MIGYVNQESNLILPTGFAKTAKLKPLPMNGELNPALPTELG
jgi:hypothetical protein